MSDSPEFPDKKKKAVVPITEDGLLFDSNEEMHFYWMLKELKEMGVVTDVFRPETFPLCDALDYPLQKGKKVVIREAMKGHEYTADLAVVWNWSHPDRPLLARELSGAAPVAPWFCGMRRGGLNEGHGTASAFMSFFEIKPVWDRHRSTHIFRINQKWVYAKYGAFVNLVKVDNGQGSVFEKLWTPRRYRFTNKTQVLRSTGFVQRSYEEWAVAARADQGIAAA